MKRLRAITITFLVLSCATFVTATSASAAVTYDQAAGTWTDNYANNTGTATRSGVNVNTGTGVLQLTNAGGTYTAPFNSTGYVYTTTIMPTSVVEWGTLTWTGTVPEGTSVTIQVMDEGNYLYSDSLVPGNTDGFTTSSIDISSVPPLKEALFGKVLRLRLKITMTTSDTSVTPSIDTLSVSWDTSNGTTSASPLADTAWPSSLGNARGTQHSIGSINYPVLRWINEVGADYGGTIIRGLDNTILVKTIGGTATNGKFIAINRLTGSVLWEREITGYGYSSDKIALAQDGTFYMSDIFNDIFLALDSSDGSIKWSYQFSGGHGNAHVCIGSDGTIYTTRSSGDDIFTLYAFNPDGTIKWTQAVNPPGKGSESPASIGPDGKIYVNSTTYNASWVETNNGALYSFNPVDGSLSWSYNTGDISSAYFGPVIDVDGTVYVANTSDINTEKSIYAINPDGTLKWQYPIGETTFRWSNLSLGSNNRLVAYLLNFAYPATGGKIEIINAENGSLVWNRNLDSEGLSSNPITDSKNGIIVRNYKSSNSTNFTYYDADNNFKWKFGENSSDDILYAYTIQDESGYIYSHRLKSPSVDDKLFALYPWTLSAQVTGPADIFPGDTLALRAVTSMQATNLFSGEANKVQAVIDNGDNVALSYESTDANGDTVWSGSYTLPLDISAGAHTVTFEANAALIETDIPVHFDSPATGTGNTGFTAESSFTANGTPKQTTSSARKASIVSALSALTQTLDLPEASSANTALQNKLQELIATLNSLREKAKQMGIPVLTPVSAEPVRQISKDLETGMGGEDVTFLQQFLISQNKGPAAQALANTGATGYFGALTRAALAEFQKNVGISPASGYFGPVTRNFINSQ